MTHKAVCLKSIPLQLCQFSLQLCDDPPENAFAGKEKKMLPPSGEVFDSKHISWWVASKEHDIAVAVQVASETENVWIVLMPNGNYKYIFLKN